jgi:hypothetical protein
MITTPPTFRSWVVTAAKTNDPEGRVIASIAHSISPGSRNRPGPIKSEADLAEHLRSTGASRDAIRAAPRIWARYLAARG